MTPVQTIESLDDPRVASYRNLRERSLRDEGVFITEGSLLAERLLQSRFPVESLFVTVENAPRFAEVLQERVPLYVAEAALMRQIVGFDFHRGVLGLGRRLPFPDAISTVEQLWLYSQQLQLLACPSTETAENLGLMLRSAAAFGVDAVLLPTDGADPLSRRCLRQSMGSALSLSVARSVNLWRELYTLRQSHSLRLVAAVAGGNESVVSLDKFTWPPRAVLIVGNEYSGLDEAWLERCDDRVTIPLAPGCDSLNVAVATGVFLHHMRTAHA
ncbi:MAG TPA: RNA methyltransferase [Abditibacteriaceae bacterium]|jgi:tRNA G18 (ribose-2'-O)-methylase SpoU